MSDIAIKVDQVSKVYRLYDRQRDRLKDALNLTRKKCYREHFALDQLDFEIKNYHRRVKSKRRKRRSGRQDFRSIGAWRWI